MPADALDALAQQPVGTRLEARALEQKKGGKRILGG